jgi:transcriptional regulator with XRE-family HTH domain
MNLLRHYRKTRNMTQLKLAAKLHMAQSEVCKVERGDRLPFPNEAMVIANYFRVKIGVLFPDGIGKRYGRTHDFDDPGIYMPPPVGVPPVHYPRAFRVRCWHCGAWISLEAGSERPLMHDELACLACSRPFAVAVPREGALA